MGVLDRLESTKTGATLFTFSRVHLTGNRGGERRNATFTIANTPWGSSPFLSTGAPFAPHRWKWSARFIPSKVHMSGDAVMDALNLALDLGRPVRLVYQHDDGYERINEAIGYVWDAPFDTTTDGLAYDISVEWEILTPWRERTLVNAPVHFGAGYHFGQTTPVIHFGSNAAVAITANTFNVPTTMCDGTVAGTGGKPTSSDSTSVITIRGPYGGDGGFTITNAAVMPSFVTVAMKLLTGDSLRLDFGAKDYLLTRAGKTSDVSTSVTTDNRYGYDFLVRANDLNPITLACLGSNPTHGGSIVVVWSRLFA